mgnify:CR=1 FL=1
MKKVIIGILVLFFLVFIISYFKPMEVKDIMEPYTGEMMPDKIGSSIYFSPHSSKELEVTGKESIDQIVTLLESMKVRKLVRSPNEWSPEFKNTYLFIFDIENKENLTINILNSKYIKINQNTYKIIEKPDLSKLYEIIILDQPKDTLDNFYYEQME